MINHLMALTKRHLLEEFSTEEWLWTDKETFEFFKNQTQPPKPKPQPPQPILARPVETVQPKATPLPKIESREPEVEIKAEVPKAPEVKQVRPPKDLSEVRTILQNKAPHLKIIDQIPADTEAKRISNAWQDEMPEVAIITLEIMDQHKELLEKIGLAIKGLGYSAKVFIGEQQWDRFLTSPRLKLMLVAEELLLEHPDLKEKYHYDDQKNRHFVDGILTCPLLPINRYFDQPKEKASLWKLIQQLLG